MSAQLMVDLETMDTSPRASIVTIGACTFSLVGDEIYDTFSISISLESNEQEGRKMSAGTIAWWLKQSKEAQMGLFEGEVTNLRQAITKFTLWATTTSPKPTHVWANDPDFDVVILKDVCEQLRIMWPFQFFMNRSVRTIQELAFPDPDQLNEIKGFYRAKGTHHKAVDDAVAQAKLVQRCYQELITCRSPICKKQ